MMHIFTLSKCISNLCCGGRGGHDNKKRDKCRKIMLKGHCFELPKQILQSTSLMMMMCIIEIFCWKNGVNLKHQLDAREAGEAAPEEGETSDI